MSKAEKEVVRELLRQARRQVKHHGHCCGYGNFRGRKLNYCDICSPTVQAITRVARLVGGK